MSGENRIAFAIRIHSWRGVARSRALISHTSIPNQGLKLIWHFLATQEIGHVSVDNSLWIAGVELVA